MNLENIESVIKNAKHKITKWIIRRQIPTWKIMLIQQLVVLVIAISLISPYQIDLNFDGLLETMGTYQESLLRTDFGSIFKTLNARRLDFQKTNIVYNFAIFFGMLMILLPFDLTGSTSLQMKTSRNHHRTDKTANIMLFVFLVWLTLCTNIFIPLSNVVASQKNSYSILSFLRDPISTLVKSVFQLLSFPFSLVAIAPFSYASISGIDKELLRSIAAGRVPLADEATLQDFYTIKYNWSLLFCTILYLVSATFLFVKIHEAEEKEQEQDEKHHEELTTKKLNLVTFETKKEDKPAKITTSAETREKIASVKIPRLSHHSHPPKIKIRPVNVTKPLNVLVPDKCSKSLENNVSSHQLRNISGTIINNENQRQSIQKESMHRGTQTTEDSLKVLLPGQILQNSAPSEVKIHRESPLASKVENGSQTSSSPSLYSKSQFEKNNTVNVGVSCYPEISHKSQQKLTTGINVSQQTPILETQEIGTQCHSLHTVAKKDAGQQCDGKSDTLTKDSSQQCEVASTNDSGQQAVPSVVDNHVQCELLTQERFLKLQQSALTLYKKTIQNQTNNNYNHHYQDYNTRSSSTMPRKSQQSENKTIHMVNKYVQVNIQPLRNESISSWVDRDPYSTDENQDSNDTNYKHENNTESSFHERQKLQRCIESNDLSICGSQEASDTTQARLSTSPISTSTTKMAKNTRSFEVQTDLFGYVLEKMIRERESNTMLYSRSDVEKTVHSVMGLSDPVKNLTESIRFKALKSQHGVWYVSLRGDVFLTVARDTLRNAQLNAELKIKSEVSSDVFRAMKNFVDNYNKLSDCFDDDEESDDESYINGFRL